MQTTKDSLKFMNSQIEEMQTQIDDIWVVVGMVNGSNSQDTLANQIAEL